MNELEKLKVSIEASSRQIEIAKNKLLVYSAGVAGCWTFLIENYEKMNILVIIASALTFLFGFGVFNNLLKTGDLYKELAKIKKDLKNG